MLPLSIRIAEEMKRTGRMHAPHAGLQPVSDPLQMDPMYPRPGVKVPAAWDANRQVNGVLNQIIFAPWHEPEFRMDERGEILTDKMGAPIPTNRPDVFNTITAFVLELLSNMFIGWFVNAAIVSAGGANILLGSAFIGLTYASVFYVSWLWTIDFSLRRHNNMGVSFAYWWTGQIGLIAFVIYVAMQIAGGAIAGTILGPTLPAATVGVPSYVTGAPPTSVGAAIGLGSFSTWLICFSLIWNDLIEHHGENERHNHQRAGFAGAVAIFLTVTTFFRNQVYCMGSVAIYFAAAVTSGTWTNAGIELAAIPFIGGGAAVGVFWLLYLFVALRDKEDVKGQGTENNQGPVPEAQLGPDEHEIDAPMYYAGVSMQARAGNVKRRLNTNAIRV